MVFSFLKRRAVRRRADEPDLNILLQLDDAAFVHTIAAAVLASEPSFGTMCLVAYHNLDTLINVSAALRNDPRTEHSPQFKALPQTIDDHIRFIDGSIDATKDEIIRRRKLWFMSAALISRATEIAERNRDHENTVTDIWIWLLEASRGLPLLLENNVVWKDDEKEFILRMVKNEEDARTFCAAVIMPKWLDKTENISSYRMKQIGVKIMR